ncbi:MAG: serine/threonine protein kinase [Planctomycetes bacterium]|nr:serine/threonine protein kinase [Planctomycetota bacterium]
MPTTTRLGPFTIEREIGRGGMGVVYLARDARLDRAVAIKALPDSLADDVERLAMFRHEAKTIAQLNHPHIAQIHHMHEHEGRTYLVLEYVPGRTLEDLIDGLVPMEALRLGAQVAEALEAAHAKGVVHRDLKPGNVMVGPDGTAKVLDFGIAVTMATTTTCWRRSATLRAWTAR